MEPSAVCYLLLKHYEGLALEAYPDPATGGAPWTIGYGRTDGVREGDTRTEDEASADLVRYAEAAAHSVGLVVRVPLLPHEFDALVSFVYNVGLPDFAGSTMLAMLNQGLKKGAAGQFCRWNHARGRVLAGLTYRREAEALLFKGTLADPTSPGFSWPGARG